MEICVNSILPGREKSARNVKDALGMDQPIILEERYWQHFDWLCLQGVDMSLWTREADICRHQSYNSYPWHYTLATMLEIDEKRRSILDPNYSRTIRSEQYATDDVDPSQVKLIERLPTDNEPIVRTYKSVIGVDVPVEMHGKYWRHLDWICELGGDHLAQEWVTYADFDRASTNLNLGRTLSLLLAQHEENDYYDQGRKADFECPLFICPMGYIDLRPLNQSRRVLFDCDGKPVSINLAEKFWNYFDWLESIGVDMKKFVRDADEQNRKQKYPPPLKVAIGSALIKDCKTRNNQS